MIAVQEDDVGCVVERGDAEKGHRALHHAGLGQWGVVRAMHVAPLVGEAPEMAAIGGVGVHFGIGVKKETSGAILHRRDTTALVAWREIHRRGGGDGCIERRIIGHAVGQHPLRLDGGDFDLRLVGHGHVEGERVLHVTPCTIAVGDLITAEVELILLRFAIAIAVHP